MQKILSKVASSSLRIDAQDKLREVASVAHRRVLLPFEYVPAHAMMDMRGSVRMVLGSRRVQWKEDWPDESGVSESRPSESRPSTVNLRVGCTEDASLVVQHSVVWTLDMQRGALAKIRREVLAQPTQNLNLRTMEGIHNTLLVLRFLHDLEGLLEQMNTEATIDAETKRADEWAALELFCRPWVLARSAGAELLRLEEFVPPMLRALCLAVFPCMVPLSALVAWVAVQSPRAFCRLHLRRIAGPRLAPCRISLDSGYRIEISDMGLEALAEAVLQGSALTFVQGGLHPVLSSAAS